MYTTHLLLSLAMLGVVTVMGDCPDHMGCTCDLPKRSMVCEGIQRVTWSELLNEVPDYVEKLWIVSSIFDAETENTGDLSKSDTQTKNNMLYLYVTRSNLMNLGLMSFRMVLRVKEIHFNDVVLDKKVLSYLFVLKQLQVVDLSFNKFEELPSNLLEFWPYLRSLHLGHNKITNLSFLMTDKTLPLQLLDLSYNDISFIPPNVFENMSMLDELNLQSNKLQYLHPNVIKDMSDSAVIHLSNNPWYCHCGLDWLFNALTSQSNLSFVDASEIRCASPAELQSVKLTELSTDLLRCKQPGLVSFPLSQTIQYMHSRVIDCNASGYPTPSVYWMTPYGPIVHPDHKYWVPSEIASSPDSIHFTGRPSYLHAVIRAHHNGSLLFEDFRYYFHGEYTCIAINPAGSVNQSLNVTISVSFLTTVSWSLIWGFTCAGCFMLISFVTGAILHCIRRRAKFDRSHFSPELIVTYPDEYYDSFDETSEEGFSYDTSPLQSYKCSPYRSPKKCVTPAEGMDPDYRLPDMSGNIRDTLESVRARLRMNMEKQVDKMRSQAEHVRQTSHRYMKNMKSSTGRTMKTLRHTSSQYVHKMRLGMVLGMEQVKCHVQSMKELCGTGHMTHTISTVSVSTDIDSNQKNAVIRSITYV